MTDLGLACCVIKIWENGLSGSVNLFKGVDVIDICTKLFCNFRRPSYRGSICPTGEKIGSSYRSFKKSRVQEIRGEPTALTEGREQMFSIKLIKSSLRVTKSRFYCVCHLSWQTVTQNILFSWLSAFFTDLPLSQCFLVDQMKKTNLLLSYRWPEMLP